MKKLIALSALLFSASALAVPYNNDRPFDNTHLASLQGTINTVFGAGTIDVVDDQSSAAVWTKAEAAVDAYKIRMLSSGAGSDNTVGIYSVLNGTEVSLSLTSGTANFSINNAGDLWVNNALASAGFGHEFGFFVSNNCSTTGCPATYYTEDDKNTGTGHTIQALTYEIADGTDAYLAAYNGGTDVTLHGDNDWLIAFEDWAITANGDFDDAVFLVEDMNDIPVPATLALFGLGLFGLGAVARRKKQA